MIPISRLVPLGLFMTLLPACTHVAGIVEQGPGQPMSTAVLSVGRPGGIGVSTPHKVDPRGHFDFYLAPTDESDLYLYDGAGDPKLTLQHIDEREIGTHMQLQLRPASGAMQDMETP
jgi:hypothetical protein